jgi:AcrR family transcriptional regulator
MKLAALTMSAVPPARSRVMSWSVAMRAKTVNEGNRTLSPEMFEKRRGTRTRNALGGALVALIHEKPFDEITVQDVLDRARVSRSTFYAHYRDKSDLFFSDAEEFCTRFANADVSPRIAPVRELLEHVAEMEWFIAALTEAGQLQDLLDIMRGCFARSFEQRLGDSATAFALAGALISLMTWWLDHGCRESPAQMDAIFHRLVTRDQAASIISRS